VFDARRAIEDPADRRCVTFFQSCLRSPVLTRDDPTAFAPPPAFGPFRVLHQIGVGALGPVFRTYEPTRDRLVAVKVFRLDVTPEHAQSLADELSRAAEAGLFHASIVEPVAAGIEGTVAYRAEEYVAAESLDVAMRHYAPASVDKVLPFITQLAGAIDFARAAGVGHGALHPRDIFVTPDEARATGFGVVDALDRVGLRAPVRRPYSPPERIAGDAWGTPADVFSLAAIAFELLTGRRPSGPGDEMGSLSGAMLGSHVDDVRAVLARAMHEEPEERFQTAGAFAAALAGAVGSEVVATATPIQAATANPIEAPRTEVAPPAPLDLTPKDSRPPIVRPARKREPKPRAEKEKPVQPVLAASEPVAESEPVAPSDPVVEPDVVAPAAEVVPLPPVDAAAWELRREESSPAATLPDVIAPDPADAGLSAPPATPIELPLVSDRLEERAFRLEGKALIKVETDDDVVDRIVAVDEYKSREPVGTTVLRSRPRPPERSVVPVVASAAADEPEIPLVTIGRPGFDEPSLEPERPMMLPVAVGLILGLLPGFFAGYYVASRSSQTPQQAAAVTSPSATVPTPGTASQAGKEWSEQAVSPTAGQPSGSASAGQPPATAPSVPSDAPAPALVDSPRPRADAARTGRLIVRSTPSGAAVTVNGDWKGRTPLTLNKLALDSYVVRIVAPGYDVASEKLTLSASSPSRSISAKLKRQQAPARSTKAAAEPKPQVQRPPAVTAAQTPKAQNGSLFVDSRPQGARVIVNGKEMGVTPLRVPDLPPGSYSVRIELADHRPWTTTARVVAGDVARVTGSLERISGEESSTLHRRQ
jgi:serine/threonine protein kinase